MFVVEKRNGAIVDFNLGKINDAIKKAFDAVHREYHPSIIENLGMMTTSNFGPKVRDGKIKVEEIQDSVEEVLIQSGYADVAKAYILYRRQHEKLRDISKTMLDYKDVVNNYLNVNDWRVKENATVTYSVGGLILSNSGAVTANYWLSEVYDDDICKAHKDARIHIHDLSMLTGYCAGWSLKQLIQEGLGGISGKITSSPAKHLSTLCNQMVNFLGIMQNEWAGAQAFSSFDTYLAPFVKVDNLPYKEVKQCIQSFVYGVNTPSRWGTQSPFTNITLDWTVPNDLAELNCLVGGKEMDFKYKDCKAEMDMINKAFIEIMLEGDSNGRGFQYPIPTYSITKEFDWSETENNKLLFEMAAKYGIPYFSNYVNSDMEPSDVRSMCCRLRLDLRELRKKSGGFFGSGESTGSIGVVTINMPNIAYTSKTEEEFFIKLDNLMDISARSLKIKRNTIEKLLEAGLYPYTKRYLGTFNNHFSTIGLVGMNEACLNASWIGKNLTNKEAVEFTQKVLNHMRNRLSDYQEKYGDLYNLEATPAESTAYRLAKHDKDKYPDIITANMDGTPYYTNSSHLPVGYTEDVFSALDIQDGLQTLYTSGTVFHTFLGEKLPDWKAAANLVRTIANNYKLPYYTLSPTYSICKNHGYIKGEVYVCPECGEKTEVNSRITGYYRPVQNWNDGKAQEFKDRKTYVMKSTNTAFSEIDHEVSENQIQGEASTIQANNQQTKENISLLVQEAVQKALQESGANVDINTLVAKAIQDLQEVKQKDKEEEQAEINANKEEIAQVEEEQVKNENVEVEVIENKNLSIPTIEAPQIDTENNEEIDYLSQAPKVENIVENVFEGINIENKKEEESPKVDMLVGQMQFKDILPKVTVTEEVMPDKDEQEDIVKLFTTKTCPNCRKAEELLDKAGISYSIIDAMDNPMVCARLGIMQAPTLMVNDSFKYVNLSNIVKYVETKMYAK